MRHTELGGQKVSILICPHTCFVAVSSVSHNEQLAH